MNLISKNSPNSGHCLDKHGRGLKSFKKLSVWVLQCEHEREQDGKGRGDGVIVLKGYPESGCKLE